MSDRNAKRITDLLSASSISNADLLEVVDQNGDPNGNPASRSISVNDIIQRADKQFGGTYVAIAGEDTLQDRLADVPEGNNGEFNNIFLGEVLAIPSEEGPSFGRVDFSLVPNTPSGITLEGVGRQAATSIIGSGDHSVKMNTNDPYLGNISVRQEDTSGNYDAIYVDEREARIYNVAIDHAPRHAINITGNGRQSIVTNCEISAGDDSAVKVAGTTHTHDNIQIKTPPSNGLEINANGGTFNYNLFSVPDLGCYISGSGNQINLTCEQPGGTLVRVFGDRNTVRVSGRAENDSEAVDIEGDDNLIICNVENNLFLDSSSNNNVIIGRAGSVTDNGTSNNISSLIT